MKNFLLFLSLCFSYSVSAAPTIEKKEVVCDTVERVFQLLGDQKYNEVPNWLGATERTRFVLLVNREKKTWSLVEHNRSNACIVGAGINSEFFNIELISSNPVNLRNDTTVPYKN